MKTLSRFVTKFTSLIVAVLSCFDRVIFKGYLPITHGPALEGFVDHVLRIRRKDFMAFAEEQSETVVEHAKRLAQEAGAEYRFLQGKVRKDKLVDKILRQRPIFEGLICVLCCMECCPSFQLVSGKDRPRLVNQRQQQRVLYFYFLDPELGLIYIRLTTWFPLTVQVIWSVTVTLWPRIWSKAMSVLDSASNSSWKRKRRERNSLPENC